MSTTAEKLQQIKSIKNDLKEKINAKGGSITDTTPFAEYPTIADELMGGGSSGGEGSTDMLQQLVDTANNCDYLFYFYSGENLDFIKKLDISKITSARNMFYGSKITKIPDIDFSNLKYCNSMFKSCSRINEPIKLKLSNATTIESMFSSCNIIPEIDFQNSNSQIYNMQMAFDYCYNLNTVKGLNFINCTSVGNAFNSCPKLTNLEISNVRVALTIGSGTSWGHLLTLDSLLNTIKELIDTGSSLTLTMGSANLDKIANVYVKLTGEAEEDDTLPKLPFVVCESTDEGAMLITDYVTLKNWALA